MVLTLLYARFIGGFFPELFEAVNISLLDSNVFSSWISGRE